MLEFRHILFINVSRIGDTLLATPALRAIAAANPSAQITCLGHPNRIEILEHLPYVTRAAGITKNSAWLKGWLCTFGVPKPYDIAFVYGHDGALIRYALRVSRQVIAFRQKDEGLNCSLFAAVDVPPFQSEHSVMQLLRLPAAVGISPAGLRLAYVVTEAERSWAQGALENAAARHFSPLIGLQVASFPTKAYRDWPIEHFIALTDMIRAEWPQAHFLIFGGSEEKERTHRLSMHLGQAGTLFAGKLNLRQTVALMNETDLYIGVDTGPTHLMSALDIPMIGLYHCFSPSHLIGPLEHPMSYLIDHPKNGISKEIEIPMSEIGVNMVFTRVVQALTEHPPRAAH